MSSKRYHEVLPLSTRQSWENSVPATPGQRTNTVKITVPTQVTIFRGISLQAHRVCETIRPPRGGRRAAHPVMSQNSYHSISIVLDLTKESEASFELQGHTAQGSDTGDTVGNGGLPRCHGGRPTRFHHIQHEQLSLALLPTCTPHHCQRKRHG